MQLRHHPATSERGSTGGYSLIELVVVIVLLSIIGGISFFVVLESMRVYARTQPRIEASYEANLVASRLMRDVRDIPDSQSITSFGNAKLEFRSSLGESVSYEYADGVLLRNGQPLAEQLADLAFSFITVDGVGATAEQDIHLVQVRLVAQSASETVPMALTVFPRGLQR